MNIRVLKPTSAYDPGIPPAWPPQTKSGESVVFENAYNDTAEVELSGNTVQASDYYVKDGLSSQAGIPTPDIPIPITSNLAAGTYKYTSTDGIYEFTLAEELRGINGVADRVVFDRKSHRGILEKRNAGYVVNGTEEYALRPDIPLTNHWVFQNETALLNSRAVSADKILCDRFKSIYDNNNDTEHISNIVSIYSQTFKIFIHKTRIPSYNVSDFKAWLTTNNTLLVYQLNIPMRTPLTFTKVASSSAPEVPITFLTNTPSLDYPADVTDATGNLLSNNVIIGAFPVIRKVGLIADTHIMRTGKKNKRIEKIDSYAGQSITTPYLSTTGALTTGATVLYQLVTPVEESYTPVIVPTYLGQTVISTDSVVKPTITATVKVLRPNLQPTTSLENFSSLIWTDRYSSNGDFEFCTSVKSPEVASIQPDYILEALESEHAMIIENFLIESDVEQGDTFTVSGRSLESILDRRIVWNQTILNGNLQTAIIRLLNENAINPTDINRKIPGLIYELSTDPAITSLTIDAQYTGPSLYLVIESICKTNDIGFKITLNDQYQMVFKLYAGKDHSYSQLVNPYVVFSPKFENILNSNYLYSSKIVKNVTLVAGEGEGSLRKTIPVGAASGLQRRELFTDARDISSKTDAGVLTAEAYNLLLLQRGVDKLAEKNIVESFEGTADTTHMFTYGKDFLLGDIVQLANEYGHEGKTRVTEVVYSESGSEVIVVPTFSTVE